MAKEKENLDEVMEEITENEQESLGEEVSSAEEMPNIEEIISGIDMDLPEEDLDDDAADNLGAYFERRTVDLVSRTRNRKLNRDEDVVNETFDGVKAFTDKDREKLEYRLLSEATKSGALPLTGKIIGMETNPSLKSIMAVVELCLENYDVHYENISKLKSKYKIIIPIEMLYDYNEESLKKINFEDPEKQANYEAYPESQKKEIQQTILERKLKNAVVKRIGSKIEFFPYRLEKGQYVVVASRLAAMRHIAQHNYIKKMKPENLPLIAPGVKGRDQETARITSVSRYGIVVEVKGADCYIPNRDLSHTRIMDAGKLYYTGDTIRVRVTKVEPYDKEVTIGTTTKKFRLVRITADAKSLERSPIDEYWDEFHVGDFYAGVVSQILDTGKMFVTVCDKVDVLCLPSNKEHILLGAKCSVEITDKKVFPDGEGKEARQIHGKIFNPQNPRMRVR